MPLIDLTYPAGTFTPDARTALVDELTTVLLRAERAPDTEFFRNIAWVHVHELPDGYVLAAGRPVTEPTFRVHVTIPQGALSARRKQELVSEATRVVCDAAGIDESLRVWVLINEVPDGNWGAGGQVISLEQLVGYAAQERKQPGSAKVAPPAQTVTAGVAARCRAATAGSAGWRQRRTGEKHSRRVSGIRDPRSS